VRWNPILLYNVSCELIIYVPCYINDGKDGNWDGLRPLYIYIYIYIYISTWWMKWEAKSNKSSTQKTQWIILFSLCLTWYFLLTFYYPPSADMWIGLDTIVITPQEGIVRSGYRCSSWDKSITFLKNQNYMVLIFFFKSTLWPGLDLINQVKFKLIFLILGSS
jgi:hypothetical protein